MSNSIVPWIKATTLKLLQEIETTSTDVIQHNSKICQVTSLEESLHVLTLSDSQLYIYAFLTHECIEDIIRNYGKITHLKNAIIKLENYHFSTTLQNSGNRDIKKIQFARITYPLSLQVSKLKFLGGHDSTTIGYPLDVNLHIDITKWLKTCTYKKLVEKLVIRQFPNEYYLPDYDGKFTISPLYNQDNNDKSQPSNSMNNTPNVQYTKKNTTYTLKRYHCIIPSDTYQILKKLTKYDTSKNLEDHPDTLPLKIPLDTFTPLSNSVAAINNVTTTTAVITNSNNNNSSSSSSSNNNNISSMIGNVTTANNSTLLASVSSSVVATHVAAAALTALSNTDRLTDTTPPPITTSTTTTTTSMKDNVNVMTFKPAINSSLLPTNDFNMTKSYPSSLPLLSSSTSSSSSSMVKSATTAIATTSTALASNTTTFFPTTTTTAVSSSATSSSSSSSEARLSDNIRDQVVNLNSSFMDLTSVYPRTNTYISSSGSGSGSANNTSMTNIIDKSNTLFLPSTANNTLTTATNATNNVTTSSSNNNTFENSSFHNQSNSSDEDMNFQFVKYWNADDHTQLHVEDTTMMMTSLSTNKALLPSYDPYQYTQMDILSPKTKIDTNISSSSNNSNVSISTTQGLKTDQTQNKGKRGRKSKESKLGRFLLASTLADAAAAAAAAASGESSSSTTSSTTATSTGRIFPLYSSYISSSMNKENATTSTITTTNKNSNNNNSSDNTQSIGKKKASTSSNNSSSSSSNHHEKDEEYLVQTGDLSHARVDTQVTCREDMLSKIHTLISAAAASSSSITSTESSTKISKTSIKEKKIKERKEKENQLKHLYSTISTTPRSNNNNNNTYTSIGNNYHTTTITTTNNNIDFHSPNIMNVSLNIDINSTSPISQQMIIKAGISSSSTTSIGNGSIVSGGGSSGSINGSQQKKQKINDDVDDPLLYTQVHANDKEDTYMSQDFLATQLPSTTPIATKTSVNTQDRNTDIQYRQLSLSSPDILSANYVIKTATSDNILASFRNTGNGLLTSKLLPMTRHEINDNNSSSNDVTTSYPISIVMPTTTNHTTSSSSSSSSSSQLLSPMTLTQSQLALQPITNTSNIGNTDMSQQYSQSLHSMLHDTRKQFNDLIQHQIDEQPPTQSMSTTLPINYTSYTLGLSPTHTNTIPALLSLSGPSQQSVVESPVKNNILPPTTTTSTSTTTGNNNNVVQISNEKSRKKNTKKLVVPVKRKSFHDDYPFVFEDNQNQLVQYVHKDTVIKL